MKLHKAWLAFALFPYAATGSLAQTATTLPFVIPTPTTIANGAVYGKNVATTVWSSAVVLNVCATVWSPATPPPQQSGIGVATPTVTMKLLPAGSTATWSGFAESRSFCANGQTSLVVTSNWNGGYGGLSPNATYSVSLRP
ncbi:MAG: hypothetical protein EKK29_03075 [Hyphomicrobiales bacterium]|nr:MAG: hypothetical protein EKK29_03075 [Hyphomicrobiales bacterium]